jgi:hypothetical protein
MNLNYVVAKGGLKLALYEPTTYVYWCQILGMRSSSDPMRHDDIANAKYATGLHVSIYIKSTHGIPRVLKESQTVFTRWLRASAGHAARAPARHCKRPTRACGKL